MAELTHASDAFAVTVPGTDEPLRWSIDGFVSADGLRFESVSSMADLTDPEDRARLDEFAARYGRFRDAEGRSPISPAAIRALPYDDVSGQLSAMWVERATSYDRFVSATAELAPGTMVDVGAGCGWLALRMSEMGWSAAAVDVNVDVGDGLGAASPFADEVFLARAAMERLPFGSNSIDLVVFNASLHYGADVRGCLDEAVRVLDPDGTLVVMDSPVYADPLAGEAMVAEFAAHAEAEGRQAVELAGPGFVTEADLWALQDNRAVAHVGRHGDVGGLVGAVRGAIGRRRAGREVAKRPVIVARLGGTPTQTATARTKRARR